MEINHSVTPIQPRAFSGCAYRSAQNLPMRRSAVFPAFCRAEFWFGVAIIALCALTNLSAAWTVSEPFKPLYPPVKAIHGFGYFNATQRVVVLAENGHYLSGINTFFPLPPGYTAPPQSAPVVLNSAPQPYFAFIGREEARGGRTMLMTALASGGSATPKYPIAATPDRFGYFRKCLLGTRDRDLTFALARNATSDLVLVYLNSVDAIAQIHVGFPILLAESASNFILHPVGSATPYFALLAQSSTSQQLCAYENGLPFCFGVSGADYLISESGFLFYRTVSPSLSFGPDFVNTTLTQCCSNTIRSSTIRSRAELDLEDKFILTPIRSAQGLIFFISALSTSYIDLATNISANLPLRMVYFTRTDRNTALIMGHATSEVADVNQQFHSISEWKITEMDLTSPFASRSDRSRQIYGASSLPGFDLKVLAEPPAIFPTLISDDDAYLARVVTTASVPTILSDSGTHFSWTDFSMIEPMLAFSQAAGRMSYVHLCPNSTSGRTVAIISDPEYTALWSPDLESGGVGPVHVHALLDDKILVTRGSKDVPYAHVWHNGVSESTQFLSAFSGLIGSSFSVNYKFLEVFAQPSSNVIAVSVLSSLGRTLMFANPSTFESELVTGLPPNNTHFIPMHPRFPPISDDRLWIMSANGTHLMGYFINVTQTGTRAVQPASGFITPADSLKRPNLFLPLETSAIFAYPNDFIRSYSAGLVVSSVTHAPYPINPIVVPSQPEKVLVPLSLPRTDESIFLPLLVDGAGYYTSINGCVWDHKSSIFRGETNAFIFCSRDSTRYEMRALKTENASNLVFSTASATDVRFLNKAGGFVFFASRSVITEPLRQTLGLFKIDESSGETQTLWSEMNTPTTGLIYRWEAESALVNNGTSIIVRFSNGAIVMADVRQLVATTVLRLPPDPIVRNPAKRSIFATPYFGGRLFFPAYSASGTPMVYTTPIPCFAPYHCTTRFCNATTNFCAPNPVCQTASCIPPVQVSPGSSFVVNNTIIIQGSLTIVSPNSTIVVNVGGNLSPSTAPVQVQGCVTFGGTLRVIVDPSTTLQNGSVVSVISFEEYCGNNKTTFGSVQVDLGCRTASTVPIYEARQLSLLYESIDNSGCASGPVNASLALGPGALAGIIIAAIVVVAAVVAAIILSLFCKGKIRPFSTRPETTHHEFD